MKKKVLIVIGDLNFGGAQKSLISLLNTLDETSYRDRYRQIVWSSYICGQDDIKIKERYDYLVAGSDQIWNPLFDFNSDREFLVSTYPERRIAYAASIGIDEIPDRQKKRFYDNLKEFKAISVREDSAADIIEKIIGDRPLVVIDPTMLISKDMWEKVALRSNLNINKRYIVKYFLGEETKEYTKYIEKQAQEMSADIIEINGTNTENTVKCGPSDFLKLISNAMYVYTDSFHKYSIIYIFYESIAYSKI